MEEQQSQTAKKSILFGRLTPSNQEPYIVFQLKKWRVVRSSSEANFVIVGFVIFLLSLAVAIHLKYNWGFIFMSLADIFYEFLFKN